MHAKPRKKFKNSVVCGGRSILIYYSFNYFISWKFCLTECTKRSHTSSILGAKRNLKINVLVMYSMAWDNAYTANKEIALKSGGRFCE